MGNTQTLAVNPAENTRSYSVELFVRSLSPLGARTQQEHVINRLDELQTNDHIESYTVTIWGAGISPESKSAQTESGQRILETIDKFLDWVSQYDISFSAVFEERETSSMFDERQETVIPFPVMCLAVREGETLRCVAPWTGDSLTHSIHDCLDDLVAGEKEATVHNWLST